MLRLGWHGHSCWELRSEERSLVLDPHDGRSVGIQPPTVRADYVVITHDHFDHSAVRAVEKTGGGTHVMTGPLKGTPAGSFGVTEFASWHDGVGGMARGPNRMIMVEVSGIRVLHLGDLGHELDSVQLRALGTPDILLVPAGEVFTLGAEEAWRTIAALGPRIVAPMHYKTPGLGLPVHELESFLQGRDVVSMGQSVELEPEDLPPELEVWQFNR